MVTVKAATEKKEAAMSYDTNQYGHAQGFVVLDASPRAKYQYKSPRRLPVVVRQVPHEETHDATHDKTGEKLEKSQEMERHARIV